MSVELFIIDYDNKYVIEEYHVDNDDVSYFSDDYDKLDYCLSQCEKIIVRNGSFNKSTKNYTLLDNVLNLEEYTNVKTINCAKLFSANNALPQVGIKFPTSIKHLIINDIYTYSDCLNNTSINEFTFYIDNNTKLNKVIDLKKPKKITIIIKFIDIIETPLVINYDLSQYVFLEEVNIKITDDVFDRVVREGIRIIKKNNEKEDTKKIYPFTSNVVVPYGCKLCYGQVENNYH